MEEIDNSWSKFDSNQSDEIMPYVISYSYECHLDATLFSLIADQLRRYFCCVLWEMYLLYVCYWLLKCWFKYCLHNTCWHWNDYGVVVDNDLLVAGANRAGRLQLAVELRCGAAALPATENPAFHRHWSSGAPSSVALRNAPARS